MSRWQEKKLGDFLTQKKREVVINPNAEYSLVTISNKGIIRLREKKRGAEIAAKKAYLAKAGDFIYSRLAAHTGAFGIVGKELDNALVTGEMPCFEIDKRQALPDILTNMLNTPGVIWQLKQFTQGMGRVRVKEQMMLSLSLLLPDISEQKKISKNIQVFKNWLAQLCADIAEQQELLAELRQRILQEAIEGKLTADWRKRASRNYESAEVLLKRISQEKERLIKAGEIAKQKPLPPVADSEKPFALPQGWAWCRLEELANIIHYGVTKSAIRQNTGVHLLRITDIQKGLVNWNTVPYCQFTDKDIKHYTVVKRDILIARTGSVGKSYVVEDLPAVKALFASYLIRVVPNTHTQEKFLKVFLNSPCYWKQIYQAAVGAVQPNVNGNKLKGLLVPLPPLAEQRAIVAKTEKLLALRDSLEAEVRSAEALTKRLMQATLKEAFTPPQA